jgi:hypothetical protein
MAKVAALPPLHRNSLRHAKTLYASAFARCIHRGFLIMSDLHRTVSLDGTDWEILGCWDTGGREDAILLRSASGHYGYTSAREVHKALGYRRLRDLHTGEEITWEIRNTTPLTHIETREEAVEVLEESDEEEELDLDNPYLLAVREEQREEGNL